jgi:predicted nucleotidyltransferase
MGKNSVKSNWCLTKSLANFASISLKMSTKNNHILTAVSDLLKTKLSDNLKEVVLFGSRASGKPHQNSDFDILIVLKNKLDWKQEREISDLCYEIDLKYNIITDTHIISEAELATLRGKQPIFVNAIEKGFHA